MTHITAPVTGISTSLRRRRWALWLAVAAILVQPFASAVAHAQHFGEWGPAVSIDPLGARGVNTSANEGCPYEAPDGDLLFFASNRIGGAGMNDIWVASRQTDDTWGAPTNLTAVNSPFMDFCPTPLPGNRLLFVSTRDSLCGGTHSADIYYTRLHPVHGWLPPQHLGCEVNSAFEELSPSLVEAGGQTMLFFSSNRAGSQDIYVSLQLPDGSWATPTPVSELNSGADDARPNIRKDGLEMVFDSTRDGGAPEIYTSSRTSVFDPWSAPQRLGPNVNSTATETRATISRDGKRLYFGTTRAAVLGSSDVFVSERTGPGKK
jgi:Tol biopolymer transport system component